MSANPDVKKTAELLPPIDDSDSDQYFIFILNKCFFAITAEQVLEVVYLPELILLNTAPPDIVGVFDLRGMIIPVVDLNFRLKLPKKVCCVSDCVLILTLEGEQFGIIVDSVYDVAGAEIIDNDSMLYAAELTDQAGSPLLIASLKKEHLLITLLNPYALMDHSITQSLSLLEEQELDNGTFCPQADEKVREIFKERAENLRQTAISEDSSEGLAVAAVLLGDEYFGIALETIHEFAEFNDIVPIPGTPAYIVGCMNLRGNVITLLDIRKLLNLGNFTLNSNYKAVIVEYQEAMVGILVDNIIEVVYIHPENVSEVPISVTGSGGSAYLTGEVLYQDKLLTLINFPLLLKNLA